MSLHRHAWVAAACLVAVVGCGGEQAQQQPPAEQQPAAQPAPATPGLAIPATLPAGVTAELVRQGDEIFHGAGICYTCHGADAKGLPNLGTDLTDAQWIHTDGSYEGIVNQIMQGTPAEKSTTGTPMPPRGGSTISDDQVKAVAAYVWALSHPGGM